MELLGEPLVPSYWLTEHIAFGLTARDPAPWIHCHSRACLVCLGFPLLHVREG